MSIPASDHILHARIDTQALRHNLAVLRRAAAAARVIAVIKANAYGHGLVPTAMALSAADAFAVARIEEAVQLRAAGIGHALVLLEGVHNATQLQQAQSLGLELVVHDASQLALLDSAAGTSAVLWLKINTGMNRLGFRLADLPQLRLRVAASRRPDVSLRLMTHLAVADETDASLTGLQVQQFEKARDLFGRDLPTSIGNSAGVFLGSATHGDWVRPGIALYGISPFAHRSAAQLNLRPAMSLHSQVIAIQDVPAGEGLGYGCRWRAPRRSRIAVLAAGYADGVPRHLPDGAPIIVADQRAALVGRVSMDMLAADVTGLADVNVGASAMLWGPGLPAEEVAAAAGTIAYELLSRLGRRVALEYC